MLLLYVLGILDRSLLKETRFLQKLIVDFNLTSVNCNGAIEGLIDRGLVRVMNRQTNN